MTRCLEMEPVPNVDADAVVMRVNRNHPGCGATMTRRGIGETMGPYSGE